MTIDKPESIDDLRALKEAGYHTGFIDMPEGEPVQVSRVASTSIDAIHTWFGLTYSNYLVLPRTMLQSMPTEWQRRFVACLEELDAAAGDILGPDGYWVRAQRDGKFIADPVPQYNRGRARVPLCRWAEPEGISGYPGGGES